MIKIDKITFHEYTLIVDGNGGEDQIIIISTSGQSGHTAIKVLHVACDGGYSGWKDSDSGIRLVAHARYGELLTNDVIAWLYGVFTSQEWKFDPEGLDEIMRIFKHWFLP